MTKEARLLALIERAAGRPSIFENPRVRGVGILLAVLAFAGGGALALGARPQLLHQVEVLTWLLVLACVPMTVLANSSQFWLTAHLLNVPMPLVRAFLITLLSTAANMLPLPGGSLVRIAALKSTSTTYGQGTAVTLLVVGNRVGVGLLFAGCVLYVLDFGAFGAGALAGGLLAIVGASASLHIAHNADGIWLLALAVAQAAMLGSGALRLWLCFQALGESASVLEAVVLTLSSVVAVVVGIAPAGLGVTEAAAAGIAVTIGVPAGLAFLAAGLNRLSGLAVVGPLAFICYASERIHSMGCEVGSAKRSSD